MFQYTSEGVGSPAPPFSATLLIRFLGLTHCPFSSPRPTQHGHHLPTPSQRDMLPSHRCRQSQKHNNNSNITASTLPSGMNWQLPFPAPWTDQAHPTLGQRWATARRPVIPRSFRQELRNHPDPASQAVLDSHSGSHASRALTTIPFDPERTYQPHIFRILLLRRPHLALLLSTRRCRCRCILDPWGGHRSACAQAGITMLVCCTFCCGEITCECSKQQVRTTQDQPPSHLQTPNGLDRESSQKWFGCMLTTAPVQTTTWDVEHADPL